MTASLHESRASNYTTLTITHVCHSLVRVKNYRFDSRTSSDDDDDDDDKQTIMFVTTASILQ